MVRLLLFGLCLVLLSPVSNAQCFIDQSSDVVVADNRECAAISFSSTTSVTLDSAVLVSQTSIFLSAPIITVRNSQLIGVSANLEAEKVIFSSNSFLSVQDELLINACTEILTTNIKAFNITVETTSNVCTDEGITVSDSILDFTGFLSLTGNGIDGSGVKITGTSITEEINSETQITGETTKSGAFGVFIEEILVQRSTNITGRSTTGDAVHIKSFETSVGSDGMAKIVGEATSGFGVFIGTADLLSLTVDIQGTSTSGTGVVLESSFETENSIVTILGSGSIGIEITAVSNLVESVVDIFGSGGCSGDGISHTATMTISTFSAVTILGDAPCSGDGIFCDTNGISKVQQGSSLQYEGTTARGFGLKLYHDWEIDGTSSAYFFGDGGSSSGIPVGIATRCSILGSVGSNVVLNGTHTGSNKGKSINIEVGTFNNLLLHGYTTRHPNTWTYGIQIYGATFTNATLIGENRNLASFPVAKNPIAVFFNSGFTCRLIDCMVRGIQSGDDIGGTGIVGIGNVIASGTSFEYESNGSDSVGVYFTNAELTDVSIVSQLNNCPRGACIAFNTVPSGSVTWNGNNDVTCSIVGECSNFFCSGIFMRGNHIFNDLSSFAASVTNGTGAVEFKQCQITSESPVNFFGSNEDLTEGAIVVTSDFVLDGSMILETTSGVPKKNYIVFDAPVSLLNESTLTLLNTGSFQSEITGSGSLVLPGATISHYINYGSINSTLQLSGSLYGSGTIKESIDPQDEGQTSFFPSVATGNNITMTIYDSIGELQVGISVESISSYSRIHLESPAGNIEIVANGIAELDTGEVIYPIVSSIPINSGEVTFFSNGEVVSEQETISLEDQIFVVSFLRVFDSEIGPLSSLSLMKIQNSPVLPSQTLTQTPTRTTSPSFVPSSSRTPEPSQSILPSTTPSPTLSLQLPSQSKSISVSMSSTVEREIAAPLPPTNSAILLGATNSKAPKTPTNSGIIPVPDATETNSNVVSDLPSNACSSGECDTGGTEIPIETQTENSVSLITNSGNPIGQIVVPDNLAANNNGFLSVSFVSNANEIQTSQGTTGQVILDITLLDIDGNEIHLLDEPITICLMQEGVKDKDDTCLGYYNTRTRQWQCEDKCLKETENGYCGESGHLTSFSLLLGGTKGGGECDTSADYILAWISLAFVLLAICIVFIAIVVIEIQFRVHLYQRDQQFTTMARVQ